MAKKSAPKKSHDIPTDLAKHCLIFPNFFKEANQLRTTFEKKFADPRQTDSNRFVWDYWHIPNQYTLIRTPARYFFPKALYEKLERHLLKFGQERLGCNGISEPWLSYYIDGCEQKLHADNPHGPWAFVYSLTPWDKKRFTGGETQVARPRLLSYWNDFQSEHGEELEGFLAELPAHFNQLLVFDPRLPHGVKRVEGVRDPREGRLVLHGWFTEPRPFVQGSLAKSARIGRTEAFLSVCLEELGFHLSTLGRIHGTLSCRLNVQPSGKVANVTVLTHTLLSLDGEDAHWIEKDVTSWIQSYFREVRFPKSAGSSQITIPFLFR